MKKAAQLNSFEHAAKKAGSAFKSSIQLQLMQLDQ